ncbi:hypothetical protein GQ53DRAFT_890839 [Thozetella sp. PMI_491]|nr:hypothetical protein GQ53DRAFT_890839 [Thozetella sp. PMI_491]
MASSTSPDFSTQLAESQQTMRTRMDKYVSAWNSGDLETILSYFVDEALDYSDYGLMALHMDKKALTAYFQQLGSLFGSMDIKTTGVNGVGDFCVWECVFEFTVLEDNAGIPYEKGERGKLFSASVIHWNSDGKIVKESDYAVWGNQKGHS